MSLVPYPLRPMIAVSATELPMGEKWAYEPKFDGFRCVAHSSRGGVRLQSRQQRSLTPYFPEIATAVAGLGDDVVLDGELVIWHQGRLDFSALQERLHGSRAVRRPGVVKPAAYIVFDLLALEGKDLRPRPLAERRRHLEDLLERRLADGLVLMPSSTDPAVARLWKREHTASGIEGVVAKRVDQTYRAGGRSWRKIKARITAEAVVGGVIGSLEDPDALIVGRYSQQGRLHISGRTTPLRRILRAHLGGLLVAAAVGEHPWPAVIPSSRFGQRPSEPVEYVQVQPTTVVELDVDAAYEQNRWRHPVRYVRTRSDLQPEDIDVPIVS